MSQEISNVLSVFLVFAGIITFLFFVGQLVMFITNVRVRSDSAIAVSVGLGLSLFSFFGALLFSIGVSVWVAFASVGIFLFVGLLTRTFYQWSSSHQMRKHNIGVGVIKTTFMGITQFRKLSIVERVRDLAFSLISSTFLMYPVTQHGLTTWTTGTNDYPSYVGSALIWVNGEGTFLAQQSGTFAEQMAARGSSEKPVATAFLSLLMVITRLQPQELLSVLMWVPLFLLLMSLIALNRRLFNGKQFHQLLIILAIAGSNVPMLRLFEAQPGQVLAAGISAYSILLFFEVLKNAPLHTKGTFQHLLVSVSFAAALGTNFTLLLGAAPFIVAYIFWLGMRGNEIVQPSKISMRLASIALLTALISVPLFRMYTISFFSQNDGIAGYDIPFLSPASLFGLNSPLTGASESPRNLYLWLVPAIIFYVIVLFSRKKIALAPELILVTGFILNFGALICYFGLNSYIQHKFFALVLALVFPIVITQFVENTIHSIELKRITAISLVIISTIGTVSFQVNSLHPKTWDAVRNVDSPTGRVNVFANTIWEGASLALAVGDKISAKLISNSYWHRVNAPFPGAPFIVTGDALARFRYSSRAEIAPNIFLIQPFFESGRNMLFTNRSDESTYNLFGSWSHSEEWGTWSTGRESQIFLHVPLDLETESVTIRLDVQTYQPSKKDNPLFVVVNEGNHELRFSAEKMANGKSQFVLNRDELERSAGFVSIQLYSEFYLSPSDFGSSDQRKLGVGLRGLSITPNYAD